MYILDLSSRFVRSLSRPGLAAGLVTSALLSACGLPDTGSLSAAVNSPPAASFAVLANAAITCTDGTINGSAGTFLAPPPGSITLTSCSVTATDVGDSAAVAAYNSFLSAYAALAPRQGDACTQLTGSLDGVTLAPGVYCFDAAAALTGVLTLNGPANGTWIFKVGTSGTGALTGTNFSVVMAGGAVPCNVTWWVAEAATLTSSHFVGNILAGAGITFTGGTSTGNAWSKADVTVTGTSTTACASASVPGVPTGKAKCNQGLGNGPEGCDPGNSNHHNPTNDESGGTPGHPGRH